MVRFFSKKQIKEYYKFLNSFEPENYGKNKKEKQLSKDIIKIIRRYSGCLSYIIGKNSKYLEKTGWDLIDDISGFINSAEIENSYINTRSKIKKFPEH